MKKVLVATIVAVVLANGLSASDHSIKMTECVIKSSVINGVTNTISKCTEEFKTGEAEIGSNSANKAAINSMNNINKMKDSK